MRDFFGRRGAFGGRGATVAAVLLVLSAPAVCAVAGGSDFPVGCGPTRADDLKTAFSQAATTSGTSVTLTAGCTYSMTWDGASVAAVDGSPTIFGTLVHSVTIRGNGATIERATGSAEARFFHISPSGRLYLQDVTLRGGVSRGDEGAPGPIDGQTAAAGGSWSGLGGAVYSQGDLLADRVSFDGNQAIGGKGGCSVNGGTGGAGGAGMGGAIFSSGQVLDVARSTFSDNLALGGAAGDYGCPGGGMAGAAAGGGGGGMGGSGAFWNNLGGNTGVATDGGFGGGGGGAMFVLSNSGGDGGFGGGAGGTSATAGEFGTPAANGGFAGGAGAGLGGAVFVEAVASGGYASLVNDTFSANMAMGADSVDDGPNGGWGVGGAIFLHSGSLAAAANTLADNGASGGNVSNPANAQNGGNALGGGIYIDAAANLDPQQIIVTTGSVVAGTSTKGNPGTADDPDISGVIASQGYNLVSTRGGSVGYVGTDLVDGTSALLSVLGNHGGPTLTFEPQAGSAAIDAVPVGICAESEDQRGNSRPFGNGCDIGSVEVNDIIFADGFE